MFCSNYRDFYQIALIPTHDWDSTAMSLYESSNATHWLIALEGSCSSIERETEFYSWKVSVYPAHIDGSFDYSQPYYSSLSINSFEEASDLAKNLAKNGHNNTLQATNLQERIS